MSESTDPFDAYYRRRYVDRRIKRIQSSCDRRQKELVADERRDAILRGVIEAEIDSDETDHDLIGLCNEQREAIRGDDDE